MGDGGEDSNDDNNMHNDDTSTMKYQHSDIQGSVNIISLRLGFNAFYYIPSSYPPLATYRRIDKLCSY